MMKIKRSGHLCFYGACVYPDASVSGLSRCLIDVASNTHCGKNLGVNSRHQKPILHGKLRALSVQGYGVKGND